MRVLFGLVLILGSCGELIPVPLSNKRIVKPENIEVGDCLILTSESGPKLTNFYVTDIDGKNEVTVCQVLKNPNLITNPHLFILGDCEILDLGYVQDNYQPFGCSTEVNQGLGV